MIDLNFYYVLPCSLPSTHHNFKFLHLLHFTLLFSYFYFKELEMLFPQLHQDFQVFASQKIKASITDLTIPDMLLIQKQSELLAELKKNQERSKKCHNFSTETSELSFESMNRTRNNLNASISSICLSRDYSKYLDDEYSSEEILDEIKRYCSNRVYNFVRNKLRISM